MKKKLNVKTEEFINSIRLTTDKNRKPKKKRVKKQK
jgi:hypothetical protein